VQVESHHKADLTVSLKVGMRNSFSGVKLRGLFWLSPVAIEVLLTNEKRELLLADLI